LTRHAAARTPTTVACYPGTAASARWGEAVDPGYVRFSVGCEPAGTLWRDVERALAAVPG